jgi:hypothetical protein
VTRGISAPLHSGFYAGLGTAFSFGAAHKLAPGATVQDSTTLRITVSHLGAGLPSISTQIAECSPRSTAKALAIVSTDLDKLLGAKVEATAYVAMRGGDLLDFASKIVTVVDPATSAGDLF